MRSNKHGVGSRILSAAAAALIFLGGALNAYANGSSFYEKVATMEQGKLSIKAIPADRRPRSLRLLCAYGEVFKSNQQGSKDAEAAKTFASFRSAIEAEIAQAPEPDIKAWKRFVLGRALFESQRFDEATSELQRAADLASDAGLRASALQDVSIAFAIRHDMVSSLKTIERLKKEFPGVAYREDLKTYPSCVCEAAWPQCGGSGSLIGAESLLELIRVKQESVAALAKAKGARGGEYVAEALELGKLYEKFCPLQTMYELVCADSVRLYREIAGDFPTAPGADYAFFHVQQSQFAYEYEGDEIARAADIVRLYGPFLERYPLSPLAAGARFKYDAAKKVQGKMR